MSLEQVVSGGACVGCGGCEVISRGRIPVEVNILGYRQAQVHKAESGDLALGATVCPFSGATPNETVLSSDLFPDLPVDDRLGRFGALYAGSWAEPDDNPHDRSSGGLTTWVLLKMMESGLVDGIVHVGDEGSRSEYVVSTSMEELKRRRKSRYQSTSFGKCIDAVRGDGKRYAFVGVPCAVTAMRHLMRSDKELAEQFSFLVGIVCGHMKSAAYGEAFAWQLGVPPDRVAKIDFRLKDPKKTSREYSFGVQSMDSSGWITKPTLELVGGSWGHAVFQLEACDYCDDVFAETADVVLGDAWLPKYEIDWRGTNVVVTRNPVVEQLFEKAIESGELDLDRLTPDEAAETQLGNFRHRRNGLAVRLADDKAAGRWSPAKRVQPSLEGVSEERIALIRQRRKLSRVSHGLFLKAKDSGDLKVYTDGMKPLIEDYQSKTRLSFSVRLKNKARRESARVARSVNELWSSRVRKGAGPGVSRNLFVVMTGVNGNVGDAVIRREVRGWFDAVPAHVYAGAATKGWLEQLRLDDADTLYLRGARKAWFKQLILSASRPVLVLDPGEVPLNRAHRAPEATLLLLTLVVRIKGGTVIRPPRAIGKTEPVTLWIHRLASLFSQHTMWREDASRRRIGSGTLVPDTAFAPGVLVNREDRSRSRVVVSLRAKRPLPGDAWLQGVADFSEARGLRLTVLSQVDEDEPRTRELGDLWGRAAEVIPWSDRGDADQEDVVRAIYEEADVVISDRLHVLLIAAQHGANPIEIVPNPVPKISTHFATAGIREVSYDATLMSAQQIAKRLELQSVRPDIQESFALAAQRLQTHLNMVRFKALGTR